MVNEIEFSVIAFTSAVDNYLQPLLDIFSWQHNAKVRLQVMEWETAWADLVKVALYSHGADVSLIGSTWVGNLVVMNSLRPFVVADVEMLGGEASFLEPAWRSVSLMGDETVWAIPWLADTRLIYYRRDWLERAGIEEATAFATPAHMEHTLECLRESGCDLPWAMATRRSLSLMHYLASWVWGAQGDFISADGRTILFNRSEAREGMRNYFGLRRFLTPETQHLNDQQAGQLLTAGRAAAALGGPWIWLVALGRLRATNPELADNIGVTFPPGVPWVGGINLVIWKHTCDAQLALSLVRYLTSAPVQTSLPRLAGYVPVRSHALTMAALAEDPLMQRLQTGLQKGRPFWPLPLWGLVEDKLSLALGNIWEELLAESPAELEVILDRHLEPLARRLGITLSNL